MSAGEEWANLASRSRAHTATTQGSYREQKWVRRQKKVFKNWVNLRIAGRNVQPVKDLFVDLQDGWVMYHLCEALGGTSLRSLGKMSKGKMRLHHVANMNIVFKYLQLSAVPLIGIGPQDIVDGNPKLVLGMCWSIIVFFLAKELEAGGGGGINELKKKIIGWANEHVGADPELYGDQPVTNLTGDWQDGRVFSAILDSVAPEKYAFEKRSGEDAAKAGC